MPIIFTFIDDHIFNFGYICEVIDTTQVALVLDDLAVLVLSSTLGAEVKAGVFVELCGAADFAAHVFVCIG